MNIAGAKMIGFKVKMKNLLKKRNLLRVFIDTSLFIMLSFLSAFLVTFSTDYKLDKIAYSLNNYNVHCYTDSNYQPSILSINPNCQMAPSEFEQLFKTTYYTDLNDGIREANNYDGFFNNYSIHLETQLTFSVETNISKYGGYRLDYGLYYTYYSDDILGTRGYLKARYDCESFIFISDSFANKLIEFYNIKAEDPYKELILNENYCVLKLLLKGTKHTFCINNIIFSTLGQGPRTGELYGDFALFCYNSNVKEDIFLRYEMDLKDNPYCIKSMLSTVDSLGFNYDNSSIKFMTFNYKESKYHENHAIELSYRSIDSTRNSYVLNFIPYFAIFIAIVFLVVFHHFYLVKDYCMNIFSLTIIFILFFIYGIISNFVYVHPMFSVFPIGFLISYSIIFGKEVWHAFKNKIIQKQNNSFCEIDI